MMKKIRIKVRTALFNADTVLTPLSSPVRRLWHALTQPHGEYGISTEGSHEKRGLCAEPETARTWTWTRILPKHTASCAAPPPPPGALNECAARSLSSRMWTSGRSSQSHLSLTSVSRLRETQVERLVGDEATEEQVRVVVEAIEELELVEAEQHLYIHIHMQQGKASESSE